MANGLEERDWVGTATGSFALLIPISATLFETGYFTVVGFQYAAVFSLADHLVFAIRGVPTILLSVAVCALVTQVLSLADKFDTKIREVVRLIAVMICVAFAIYYVESNGLLDSPRSDNLNLSLNSLQTMVGPVMIGLAYTILVYKWEKRPNIFQLNLAIVALFAAWSLGFIAAISDMNEAIEEKSPLVRIDDESDFRLIRFGGEHSILYTKSGNISVIPTARVKLIEDSAIGKRMPSSEIKK